MEGWMSTIDKIYYGMALGFIFAVIDHFFITGGLY